MAVPVPAKSLEKALEYCRDGATLYVRTYTRTTVITAKTLASFEKSNIWLLKEDGDGYRMRTGKTSVYLFPNQLMINQDYF
jgi:hypothetical protein